MHKPKRFEGRREDRSRKAGPGGHAGKGGHSGKEGVQGGKGVGQGGRPTHWGKVAGWYDELVGDEGSEYHREVILPGILRMLDLRREGAEKVWEILDVACGQGVLCRKLAGMGHKVMGVDAAEPLIAAARRRDEQEGQGVKYIVGDATKLVDEEGKVVMGELKGKVFDAVTIVLAIQNITPLSPVWKACHALLKPGGMVVVVMMHPSFRVPRQSDWLWEDATGTQVRVVRQYLGSSQIGIQTHPGLAAHGKDATETAHFHRPLQAYVNTMGNAGLWIDHMEEWASHKKSEAGPRKEGLDRARKEIPMFMAVRGRRVRGGR